MKKLLFLCLISTANILHGFTIKNTAPKEANVWVTYRSTAGTRVLSTFSLKSGETSQGIMFPQDANRGEIEFSPLNYLKKWDERHNIYYSNPTTANSKTFFIQQACTPDCRYFIMDQLITR